MQNKKTILGIIFLVIIVGVSLIIICDLNKPELVKNNQEYEQKLKEQNSELSLLEQMQKLDVFKEKCKEVRADPDTHYPEIVDLCK